METEQSTLLSANAPNALGAFMDKFTTLTESYFFYGGTIELRFDKELHKYFRVEELGNLTEIKGVTKTCHIIDRSMALTPWASKKCAEKILRTIPLDPTPNAAAEIMLAPISLTAFTKLVMEAKDAHKEILVEAGDIGHLAHKCLEDSIQHAIDHTGGVVHELRNLPEDAKALSAAQAALAWMQKHNVRWIKTEQKIYSREYEYAGTMDGSAMVDSCDDATCCTKHFKDHRSLIDWKSSNYLYIEYCYQTASYLGAEVEEFGIAFDDRWILRLGKNEEEAGKFEPWYLDASTFAEDFSGFLACLNLTKLVDSVTERMQVQKKGVRAAKKKQKAEQKEIDKMKAKVEKEAEKAQKKLDRAAERERIKKTAKENREALKNAKKTNISGVVSENTTTSDMGRPEPINEVPRQAVYTQATPMAPAAVAEVAEETAEVSEPLHNNIEGSSEGSTTTHSFEEAIENALADNRLAGLPTPTWAEETPVERKPFVIPEG